MPAVPPATTIVIPQYGQSQLTLQCVQSFRRWHGSETPIVIVDDGSESGHVAAVQKCAPNVQCIGKAHEGVTAAWIAGAAVVKSEAIVFLNNDVVTSGGWLGPLLERLTVDLAPVAGIEARVDSNVRRLAGPWLSRVDLASGWLFAVRREAFDAVGGFEPSLRTFFSDTDLQLRLLNRCRLEAAPIVSTTQTSVRHLGHATTRRDPERQSQWIRDRARFLELWDSATGSIVRQAG
jgi:GT2 family glycosyltransferase